MADCSSSLFNSAGINPLPTERASLNAPELSAAYQLQSIMVVGLLTQAILMHKKYWSFREYSASSEEVVGAASLLAMEVVEEVLSYHNHSI